MFFLILNDADMQFIEKELTWRSYTPNKVLPMTRWMKFINKKEFAKVALDKNFKTFVVYVAALKALPASIIMIHLLWTVQIIGGDSMQVATLYQDEASTKARAEYTDYFDVFSFDLVIELSENTGINKYSIKLEEET